MISASCPFCHIVCGTAPARIVARSESAIAFFPQSPAAVGHTLVVPTDHLKDIWSVNAETAGMLGEFTLRVAHAVKEAINPDGLSIIQSNGEAATQSVWHLHIHLLPRWEGDGIGPIWPNDSTEDAASLDLAADSIRSALGDSH